jgi:hypothetical protein
MSHSANFVSACVKKSDGRFTAARTVASARFLLPPPSTHRVPHGILVSTM